MTAVSQNIVVGAGDTLEVEFAPVLDQDGIVISLASAVSVRWWMGLAPYSTGTAVLLKKSVADGTIAVQPDNSVLLTIEADDTKTLTPGLYYHEYEIVLTGDVELTPSCGSFTLQPRMIRVATP
jgi:hypothetical protein